ncbi:hypothetical protein BKA01_003972 [Pseudonocardia eucalypti]|uniref:hypothetical protein n=1 Tax=Pseudonocardia eucalypti TaxID=648755 RepID=UPI001619F3A8|nr:hypothetical protein [Pseudonocardia eucalypti]
MRMLLRVLGAVIALQGACGVVDRFVTLPWLGALLLTRTGVFGGYQLYGCLLMVTLGVALVLAANASAAG